MSLSNLGWVGASKGPKGDPGPPGPNITTNPIRTTGSDTAQFQVTDGSANNILTVNCSNDSVTIGPADSRYLFQCINASSNTIFKIDAHTAAITASNKVVISPLTDGNEFIINNASGTSLLLANTSTSVFDLGFNSTVIQPQTDGTCFTVANAAGTNVFTVDTSASDFDLVTIGGPTRSTSFACVNNLSQNIFTVNPAFHSITSNANNFAFQPITDGSAFIVYNSAATPLFSVNTSTSAMNISVNSTNIQPSSDGYAFNVKNAAGSNVFNINTAGTITINSEQNQIIPSVDGSVFTVFDSTSTYQSFYVDTITGAAGAVGTFYNTLDDGNGGMYCQNGITLYNVTASTNAVFDGSSKLVSASGFTSGNLMRASGTGTSTTSVSMSESATNGYITITPVTTNGNALTVKNVAGTAVLTVATSTTASSSIVTMPFITAIADNTCDIGTTVVGFRKIYSDNALQIVSDRRAKKDIEDLDLGLDYIIKTSPKKFKYNKPNSDDKYRWGFIYDDLESITPNDSSLLTEAKNPDEYNTVGIQELIAPMINAIKELNNKIEYLEDRLLNLKIRNF